MIVVMVDPNADRFAPLVLGVEGVGVEAFLREDSLVTLDFPVVPRRVAEVVKADEASGSYAAIS